MIKRIFYLILLCGVVYSQSVPDSIRVTPGKEFKANFFYELFFGEHWRELWTTPVKFEILDLAEYGGGIEVHKVIKNGITTIVYFKGQDGRLWKFRSLKRDPVEIVPKSVQYLVVKDIVNDQASSANPVATIIAAPLLTAVGLLHPTPLLCVLPESESFGEYKDELKHLPGTIEISVDEERKGNWNFEGSVNTTPTCELFVELEDKPKEKIDATEYLKARLMDIYLGDWERNMDQWQWAYYGNFKGEDKWHPIPQDKSHAFSKFDGLFPQMSSYYIPQLVSFGENYSDIEKISWNGRFVDRRVLPLVSKTEWDSVTQFLKTNITNDVINIAISKIPIEYFNLFGKELKESLVKRRNDLHEISGEYYYLIHKYLDIYASNKNDSLFVNRINDEQTEVKLFNSEDKNNPYFRKVVNNSETNEIRLYLMDGNDKAELVGDVNEGVKVRIIGGSGDDEYIDNSNVDGYCFHITPIPNAENKTIIYDELNSKIIEGSGTEVYNDYIFSDDPYERYASKLRNRGSSFWIKPTWSYTSDEGLILALGPELTTYGFNKIPFETKTTFWFAYLRDSKSFSLFFNSDLIQVLPNLDFKLKLFKTQLLFDRFFGFGNETVYSEKLENDDYYKVGQEVYLISGKFEYKLKEKLKLGFGLAYEEIEFNPESNSILAEFKERVRGIGEYWLLGTHIDLEYDTRLLPHRNATGFYAKSYIEIYPKFNDNNEPFYKAGFEAKYKIPFNSDHSSSISWKIGGENVWGKYPFFKAAFLGGKYNLRGFSRERFAGDGSIYGQAELELYLTNINLIIPNKFGLTTFFDVGRVFEKNEHSTKLHSSYGGGIWITPLERKLGFSFTIAKSKERMLYYISSTYSL